MTTSTAVRQGQRAELECEGGISQEVDDDVFRHARLGRWLRALLGQFAQAPGQSIALVCQDWANIKAAYRFLS